ncbi:hypothetical protein OS493_019509 [Desmophyllum pertusum]|uniref:Arachidonate 5-lipoxygenase n=1 Tax=Desmophyllum pertusum TaxID=174260 RepID=A0A9W9ZNA8_9CNID|nr:hypothetical protein OS493_019509 [Desmophyllum pertusum]
MSITRVTIHGEEKKRCTVKTEDGRWCHFPFTYGGKVYHKCTTDDYRKPWCSTTENYKGRWGVCEEKDNREEEEAKNCNVKTEAGEWCHFPFTYKGVIYEECTNKDLVEPWCSTNGKYRWGVCAVIPKKEEKAAVQAALQTADSLEEAMNQDLIYALRYELCDDMIRSEDLTDNDTRRTMWNFLSPIALFASAVDGQYNELVPVAIQMDFKPDSKVYTPKDGDNWLIAKLNVQVTDIGYAQIVEHLAKCHFLMEPFCVSLKRTLAPMHPLYQILKYHCREVIVPNTFGTPALVNDAGFTDKLFAYGNEGKRGLADKKVLPYCPYRDDGIKILEVIENMVENYVNLYYEDDKDVKKDVELQAYLNEVSLNGTGPNGGIGQIQGLPASINSKAELCEIVSRIISQLTIQHAAVNYELSDYAEYIPNQPTKLYNDTRVEEGKFSVYRLPNRLTSAIQSSFSNSLGTFRFDTLFDYGNELDDIKAVNLINSYYGYLMEVVQPLMQDLNQERKDKGQLTYPYLTPRWVPNGIQT